MIQFGLGLLLLGGVLLVFFRLTYPSKEHLEGREPDSRPLWVCKTRLKAFLLGWICLFLGGILIIQGWLD